MAQLLIIKAETAKDGLQYIGDVVYKNGNTTMLDIRVSVKIE